MGSAGAGNGELGEGGRSAIQREYSGEWTIWLIAMPTFDCRGEEAHACVVQTLFITGFGPRRRLRDATRRDCDATDGSFEDGAPRAFRVPDSLRRIRSPIALNYGDDRQWNQSSLDRNAATASSSSSSAAPLTPTLKQSFRHSSHRAAVYIYTHTHTHTHTHVNGNMQKVTCRKEQKSRTSISLSQHFVNVNALSKYHLHSLLRPRP